MPATAAPADTTPKGRSPQRSSRSTPPRRSALPEPSASISIWSTSPKIASGSGCSVNASGRGRRSRSVNRWPRASPNSSRSVSQPPTCSRLSTDSRSNSSSQPTPARPSGVQSERSCGGCDTVYRNSTAATSCPANGRCTRASCTANSTCSGRRSFSGPRGRPCSTRWNAACRSCRGCGRRCRKCMPRSATAWRSAIPVSRSTFRHSSTSARGWGAIATGIRSSPPMSRNERSCGCATRRSTAISTGAAASTICSRSRSTPRGAPARWSSGSTPSPLLGPIWQPFSNRSPRTKPTAAGSA